ncbi:uncharacterized protein LOC123989275 [Osmia bicornis bicornis]|uniref:uncharacterized protein LOC123989275 n=1 Tax=Osmia bicornis bicornis TaxID=1437191 RepID=UPI001EAEE3E2|nr:uncharacterized protein LOC123989275 [Osmia bicornis bicornis]
MRDDNVTTEQEHEALASSTPKPRKRVSWGSPLSTREPTQPSTDQGDSEHEPSSHDLSNTDTVGQTTRISCDLPSPSEILDIPQSTFRTPEFTREWKEIDNIYAPNLPVTTSPTTAKAAHCKIVISKAPLTEGPGNIAHFIPADKILTSPTCRTLKALGMLSETNLLTEDLTEGRVIVTQAEERRIFSIVGAKYFFQTIEQHQISYLLYALKLAAKIEGGDNLRIPTSGETMLNAQTLQQRLSEVFNEEPITITICTGEIQTPPEDHREDIIRHYHESLIGGHKGVTKTYQRIRNVFDWPRMHRDVEDYIRSCKSCQEQKLVRIKTREPMLITDTPAKPFDKVALDTVGPLPFTPSGNRHILTLQCQLSKFCMAIPLPDIRAETIADAFSRYFIAMFGAPRAILTDRGTSFINQVLKGIAKTLVSNTLLPPVIDLKLTVPLSVVTTYSSNT